MTATVEGAYYSPLVCAEGERLRKLWELKPYDYAKMKAYFCHRNQCPGCSSPYVREWFNKRMTKATE